MIYDNHKTAFMLRTGYEDMLPQEKLSHEINKFDDEVWYFDDEINELQIKIRWKYFEGGSRQIFFMKEFFRAVLGASNQRSGKIYCRYSFLSKMIPIIKSFLKIAEETSGQVSLIKLKYEDIKAICQKLMVKSDGSLYSQGQAHVLASFLRKTMDHYKLGDLSDGISCELPVKLIESLFKEFVESKGLIYAEWCKRGSLNKLPIHVALIFLSDNIKILEMESTSFLVDFFKFQKSEKKVDSSYIFNQYNSALSHLMAIKFSPEKSVVEYSKRILNHYHKPAIKNEYESLCELAELFHSHGYAYDTLPLKVDIIRECQKVFDAAIVVVFMLSGFRISEVVSIKSNSCFNDRFGKNYIKTEIKKTKDGLGVVRSISGLVADAISLCNEIGYLDKEKFDCSPFTQLCYGSYAPPQDFNKIKIKKMRKYTFSLSINRSYRKWLELQPKELRDTYPKGISSHAFRHVFAAIALRRFDGRVSEKIRQHFVHSYSERYTRSYTDEKLDEDVQHAAERDLIAEIIGDIAKGDEAFYGPVAKFIRREILDTHHFLTLDEFEEQIDLFSREFDGIVPHEYGYCMPRKSQMKKAQCVNPRTGMIEMHKKSNIKNCTKCIHRISHESHADSLVRAGISHQYFINNSPFEATTKASKMILNQIESALAEMGHSL
jgi:hypothetical protein